MTNVHQFNATDDFSNGIIDLPRPKSTDLSGVKNMVIDITEPSQKRGNEKLVKFSENDSVCVYGPPDSFPSVNSQDVIKEYISECEISKVKPLDTLIDQLEAYEVINGRIPRIDLHGTKLDYKTVETLETVFMRVQTEVLDISNTCLDEDSCVSICEIIDYYNTALVLVMGSNTRVGLRGWISISQLVNNNCALEQLDLNRMVFTEIGLTALSRSIKMSSSLRSIQLINCYLNGTRLSILAEGIAQGSVIEELYLGENKITASDCQHIADIVKYNRSLRVLDLESNPIQDLGLKVICNALVDSEVTTLESLQLWNTGITCVGMQYLNAYLVAANISQKPISLRYLNIGKNKIGDEGIQTLKSGLMQNNSIERLGLASSRLSSSGVVAIAEIIADNRHLIRLDLRDNTINAAGVLALSQALRHNNTMLKINFNANFKVDASMEQELNKTLDQIRDKCNQNLETAKSQGKLDDARSMFSSLSNDSLPVSTVTSAPFNLSSVLVNILTSPWRLTKLRFFNSPSKVDLEMNAASESPSPVPTVVIHPDDESLVTTTEDTAQNTQTVSPEVLDNEIAIPEKSYNISRFQVTNVAALKKSHRRCVSESLHDKNALKDVSQLKNAYIKLNKLPVPSSPCSSHSPSCESPRPSDSLTPMKSKLRSGASNRPRSNSADVTLHLNKTNLRPSNKSPKKPITKVSRD